MSAKREGTYKDVIVTFLSAILLAMLFRSFAYQPFHIPSSSMKPTLLIGDYVMVSKYAYGYSRHSFPFSFPPFEGRILGNQPKRGDIIVFKMPRNPADRDVYIKRLVGLPGDKIQVIDGVLHINGKPVELEETPDFQDDDIPGKKIKNYIETLPEGVKHNVLDEEDSRFADHTEVYEVPPGHYFMMGDNRDNSQDSRFSFAVGFVPFENLIGRAEIIVFSTKARLFFPWEWFYKTRYNRFFINLRP